MHKRPSLSEALSVLERYKKESDDCRDALHTYYSMKNENEFFAARLVVEIVDHFYHVAQTEGLKHG